MAKTACKKEIENTKAVLTNKLDLYLSKKCTYSDAAFGA
jgi:hypothetical protein